MFVKLFFHIQVLNTFLPQISKFLKLFFLRYPQFLKLEFFSYSSKDIQVFKTILPQILKFLKLFFFRYPQFWKLFFYRYPRFWSLLEEGNWWIIAWHPASLHIINILKFFFKRVSIKLLIAILLSLCLSHATLVFQT